MGDLNKVNAPSWIDKELFTTVVRHFTGDSKAEVQKFGIKQSLAIGENFCSVMFRVEIKFSTCSQISQSLDVVIKIPPVSEHQEFVNSSPVFETEQDIYGGALNDIRCLLESIGDYSEMHPKLIYQAIKPRRVIVMEDLGARGFCRITQPLEEYEAANMVFMRLAKLHAAGFFLINEKKADFSRFNHSFFKVDDPIMKEKWLNESFETLAEVLESWGGYDEYAEKFRDFKSVYEDMGKQLYEPDPNGYNVLNHGDFHIKNLMFKKNGEKIEDLIFLDYQMCILASPCVDIFFALYFFSDDIRRNRKDELIHEYHNEFARILKCLGFVGKIPSLLDLQILLLKHGKMEVLLCAAFKLFYWTDVVNGSFEEVFTSPDSKKLKTLIMNDPRFKSFVKGEMPRLVHLGLL